MRSTARKVINKGCPLTDEFLQNFDDIDDIIDDVNSLLFAGNVQSNNYIRLIRAR